MPAMELAIQPWPSPGRIEHVGRIMMAALSLIRAHVTSGEGSLQCHGSGASRGHANAFRKFLRSQRQMPNHLCRVSPDFFHSWFVVVELLRVDYSMSGGLGQRL